MSQGKSRGPFRCRLRGAKVPGGWQSASLNLFFIMFLFRATMFFSRCSLWQENSICVYQISTWEERGSVSREQMYRNLLIVATLLEKISKHWISPWSARKKGILRNSYHWFMITLFRYYSERGEEKMGEDLWHCHRGMKAVSDAHWNKYSHLNNSSFHTHKCTDGQIPIHTPANTLQFWPEKNKTLALKWNNLCFEDWIFCPPKRKYVPTICQFNAAFKCCSECPASRHWESLSWLRHVHVALSLLRCFAFCRSERWNNKLTAVSSREVSRKQIMSAMKFTSQRSMSPSRQCLPSSAMFQHHRTSTHVPTFSPTFWDVALIWQVTWILPFANMVLP